MLKWFDLTFHISLIINARHWHMNALWLKIPEGRREYDFTNRFPDSKFSIISLKKKKKIYLVLLSMVTGSLKLKNYFQTHSSLAFLSPWGPASVAGLQNPVAAAPILLCRHSSEVPWRCLEHRPPGLLEGAPGPPAQGFLPACPASSPQAPSPYPFIPRACSYDRNKLARGRGHTSQEKNAFWGKSSGRTGFLRSCSRRRSRWWTGWGEGLGAPPPFWSGAGGESCLHSKPDP